MLFRGDSLSVLSMRACIRLDSIVLLFQAFGSRSQVRHLIALLFLVPPAAKEGKGDCEFPLCPPWILLLPLCNAGHCVPGGGYGIGLLSLMPFITGWRFYGTWLIWWRCSLAQTMLLFCWGADAQLLLVSVLPWQLITAASFFRVGVEVVSAAMLCSQAHSLTRCLRNYFV